MDRAVYIQEGIVGWYEHAGKQHWTASVDLRGIRNGPVKDLGWFRSRRRAVQAIRREHFAFTEKAKPVQAWVKTGRVTTTAATASPKELRKWLNTSVTAVAGTVSTPPEISATTAGTVRKGQEPT